MAGFARVPWRWKIGLLLFASTAINYIDRQTLNVLAPVLKAEYHWTNTDFASLVIAFRAAYALMQLVGGRVMDLLGTRLGLTIAVSFYSAVAMTTSLASGLSSFRALRFLLGAGEAANWPGAAKAVAEVFPARERGVAVALFDSGSAIGGAIAPALVLAAFHWFGNWRPVFLVTGSLGWLWVLAWRRLYRGAPVQESAREQAGTMRWRELLSRRDCWGIVAIRALLDPWWFLIADWFALYLASRGYRLEETAAGFWAPFLAADLGNFFGGGLSSWLIGRGMPVRRARKTVFTLCAPLMLALLAASGTDSFPLLAVEFSIATFGYAACATIFLTLPSDLFEPRAVASVSGLSGALTGLVTIASTYAAGVVSDRSSFTPVFIAASVAPVAAVLLLHLLIRSAAPAGNGID